MTVNISDYAKDFKGVNVRGEAVSIDFHYRGVRCRETISNLKATKANVKYAFNLRTTILHEIATKTFSYRKHFPNSKRADLFEPATYIPTVAEALDLWLETKKSEYAPKTFRGYKGIVDNYLKPKFGNRAIDSLMQSEVKRWRSRELGKLTNKTINDILTPLRGAFNDAMADRVIDFNPLDHVKNLERDSDDNADPFTTEELIRIERAETSRESERNAFLFACHTGVRISEWLCLAWEDIDLVKGEVYIRRAVVRGDYKVPKTKGSVRTVHLTRQAKEILLAQQSISKMNHKRVVEVTQSDKRRKKKESLTFVFPDTFTLEPYINSARVAERFFESFLKKLNIRYRGPNQARHTFASRLLTTGAPERWIMREMGHTSIMMFEKHYGRWMDDEMPGMSERVSKLIDTVTSESHEKMKYA